jgi:cytochrome c oxidase subunit II
MLLVAGAILLLVLGLLLLGLFRPRSREATGAHSFNGSAWIVLGGVVVPVVVLTGIYFLTLHTLSVIPAFATQPTVTVELIGHQWWWEVRYPELGVETANEIHIPVGQQVQFKLHSADVIHSFWVPELGGKTDLIPGKENAMWLQADRVGTFRGQCAEYCGLQHAHMALWVVAEPADQFGSWVAAQQQPAPYPTDATIRAGQQVFLGSACVYCHTVAGTNATGRIGPNLTHMGSRMTLAAGTVPNTRANLAGWVLDPQHIKPGNEMPPTALSGPDVQLLLAYLETLK